MAWVARGVVRAGTGASFDGRGLELREGTVRGAVDRPLRQVAEHLAPQQIALRNQSTMMWRQAHLVRQQQHLALAEAPARRGTRHGNPCGTDGAKMPMSSRCESKGKCRMSCSMMIVPRYRCVYFISPVLVS